MTLYLVFSPVNCDQVSLGDKKTSVGDHSSVFRQFIPYRGVRKTDAQSGDSFSNNFRDQLTPGIHGLHAEHEVTRSSGSLPGKFWF